MNILFAATPKIALKTLETIYESNHDLVGVVCAEEKRSGRGLKFIKSPIRIFAEDKGIKIFSFDEIKSKKFRPALEELNIDCLLVFAFGHIISEELLSVPKQGSFNIHTSLLPKYRGAAPIQRSIINCDEETGITFMKMDAGLDTGPILKEIKIPIKEGINTEDLEEIMSDISSRNILQVIDSIEENNFSLKEQNESESSYANKITKDEARINWAKSAEEIVGKINGLCPNPCAFSEYKNERIIFYRARVTALPALTPGEIIRADKNELLISGLDRCVEIKELARQNKKRMQYISFYNGSNNFFNSNESFK
jgi:methionyl-tRNA formyltransferase